MQKLELSLDSAKVEVVVVDNNSTDQTAEVVVSLKRDWRLGSLHYLYESRQGKQFALNRGIEHSVGDVLAFTDDDVLLPKDWLNRILLIFDDPKIELVGGKTLAIWPDGRCPNWFHQDMLAVVAGVDIGDECLRPPPEGYSPAGTNLIARRSLFQRIGGYSETHYRHMDYEFGTRAIRLGAVVEYNPTVVVHTHVPSETINKRYFRRWYFKMGIASAMRKDTKVVTLLWVPRWIWRQLLVDVLRLAWQYLRFAGAANRFRAEMSVRKLLGNIAANWHERLYPDQHSHWVAKWSQKKGQTFG